MVGSALGADVTRNLHPDGIEWTFRIPLEAIDPELAELVEMRYFGGYSETEIAELQGITDRTVRRRWDKARAWLYVALNDTPPQPPR